eukprot:scaffold43322_cov28-Tisochrysis_lutea.AAC.1
MVPEIERQKPESASRRRVSEPAGVPSTEPKLCNRCTSAHSASAERTSWSAGLSASAASRSALTYSRG